MKDLTLGRGHGENFGELEKLCSRKGREKNPEAGRSGDSVRKQLCREANNSTPAQGIVEIEKTGMITLSFMTKKARHEKRKRESIEEAIRRHQRHAERAGQRAPQKACPSADYEHVYRPTQTVDGRKGANLQGGKKTSHRRQQTEVKPFSAPFICRKRYEGKAWKKPHIVVSGRERKTGQRNHNTTERR